MNEQNQSQPSINQPEQIPLTPPEEPKEQKRFNKLFVVVLSLMIIAGISYGAYLYFSPTKIEKTISTQVNLPVNYTPAIDRNVKRIAVTYILTNALKNYHIDNGEYPKVRSNSVNKTGIFSDDQNVNPLVPEYMKNTLVDPMNNNNYNYYYDYGKGLDLKEYLFFAKLEPEYDQQTAEEYICVDSYTVNNNPTRITFNPLTLVGGSRCKKEISQEKQQELDSPDLIGLLKQIQVGLEMYQDENKHFPAKLIDLYPSFFTDRDILQRKDIFYAYSPAENPQKCHLGIIVSSNAQELDSDKDFNSKSNNYINGFDGKDPVYDLTN